MQAALGFYYNIQEFGPYVSINAAFLLELLGDDAVDPRGDRLPTFTDARSALVKSAADLLASTTTETVTLTSTLTLNLTLALGRLSRTSAINPYPYSIPNPNPQPS